MITKERAYSIASSWGSYVNASDPGACLFSFHVNDGRPVSEAHRTACLRRLQTIKPSTKTGRNEINALVEFLISAPLRPDAVA